MAPPPGGPVPDPDAPADGAATRAAAAAQVFVGDPSRPVLLPEDRHHLSRVLRLADGEAVVAADGRGTWVLCRWRAGADELQPVGDPVTEPAPAPALTVAFAPAKGDRPEWTVQKLTEVGVDRIVPLATERGVVRWDADPGRAGRAVARLQRVARAAAAQCRRTWLPVVSGIETVASLAGAGAPGDRDGRVSIAQPGGGPPSLAHPVVAVGPEGGWGPGELGLGLPRVGLGPLVLRSETAAVAAGVLLAALRAGTVACSGGPERAGPVESEHPGVTQE